MATSSMSSVGSWVVIRCSASPGATSSANSGAARCFAVKRSTS